LIDEDGLAVAGGFGMHPPIGEALDRAEGEEDGCEDGDGVHGRD
jgi:hypothetical protein